VAINAKIINQYRSYYNSVCYCWDSCGSYPECGKVAEDGYCCHSTRCEECFKKYVKYTPKVCIQKHNDVTVFNVDLVDLHYNKTVNADIEVYNEDGFYTNTSVIFSNVQSCYYTYNDFGFGNTITLHEGIESGLHPGYVSLIVVWFCIFPLMDCANALSR
jgi:hypothetical protein